MLYLDVLCETQIALEIKYQSKITSFFKSNRMRPLRFTTFVNRLAIPLRKHILARTERITCGQKCGLDLC